jgi:hypothetical protein
VPQLAQGSVHLPAKADETDEAALKGEAGVLHSVLWQADGLGELRIALTIPLLFAPNNSFKNVYILYEAFS